jgi:chromosomal replication initiator protein
MTRSDQETWESVLQLVSGADPDPQLLQALGGLEPAFVSPQRLEIKSPSPLDPDARGRLAGVLAAAASRVWGRDITVQVLPDLPAEHQEGQLNLPFRQRAATEPHEQLRLNPTYIFENFVVAPSNRLAHAACVAICEAPGKAYNPLFLHGTVGLGKSHLLQAICHRLLGRNPEAKILYLSCVSFVNQFIASVERGELDEFRYRYRHLDVLVIDDIHFLAEKERTQEEFFHTFNTLYQSQRQVILSSDSPPHEIPHLEERLISRFKWGLVARIDKPGFETRVAIVTKKARIRGIELPEEVARFVARSIDTNVRELEGAVTRIGAHATLTGAAVTLKMAAEVLADSVAQPPREISVPQIMAAVTRHFSVRISDLQGKKRSQSITLPRQICMHLARKLTRLSLEEIGGYFGGRDHTTVLHADRKIEDSLRRDGELRGTLDAIIQAARSETHVES